MPLAQETIHYSTYVKKALVEGMRAVFANHVDNILKKTKVDVEFPLNQASYPAVVIRFFERDITNLGVGHREWIPAIDPDTGEETDYFIKYKHYYFTGDIEFAIYGLSSVDRDLIGDSIVQTLGMGELLVYTNNLFQKIYNPDRAHSPESDDTFINLNTDRISGFGETQAQAPWLAEDVLVYQKSYRIGISGEFYSLTPDSSYGTVYEVDVYPYIQDLEPPPAGLQDTVGFCDDFTSQTMPTQYSLFTDSGPYSTDGDAFLLGGPTFEGGIKGTYSGDFQIDTHFHWLGTTNMDISYSFHNGAGYGQSMELALQPDFSMFKLQTGVPGRQPLEWVFPPPYGFQYLASDQFKNVDTWFRITAEGWKITGELWLANPNQSLKTYRIFKTAYVMNEEERVGTGGALSFFWTGGTGDKILDWCITTPNQTPWASDEWIGDNPLPAGTVPTPPPPALPGPIADQNYQLVFNEDFNKTTEELYASGWTNKIWYDGDPDPLWLADGFQEVVSGKLHQRTKRSFIWHNPGAAEFGLPTSGPYPNNTMTTLGSYQWQYGYFEARMKWTDGKGTWPAFWLFSVRHSTNPASPLINPYCAANGLPADYCYSGEIDIFEGQGGPTQHPEDIILYGIEYPPSNEIYYATIHKNSSAGYGVPDQQNDNFYWPPSHRHRPLSGEFNTYGLLWEPDIVIWYLNDIEVTRYTPYLSSNQPMYMLLSQWVGGWSWPLSDNPAETPDTLETIWDWIHVFQKI